MKTIVLITSIAFIFCFISCDSTNPCERKNSKTSDVVEAMQGQQQAVKAKDGIFIHLSHGPEDPQRVLMALNMAKMMSENKEVLVYIDIKGVFTVLKDAENVTFNQFPGSLELLAALKEKGVTVMVCPGCLKAAGKTPDDVVEWVQLANKDAFFNFTDGRIISIDY